MLCIKCLWKNHDKSDPFGSFFCGFVFFFRIFEPQKLAGFFLPTKKLIFLKTKHQKKHQKKLRKTLRVFLSSDRNSQRSLSPCRSATSDFLEPWRISVNESDGVWIWTEKNRTQKRTHKLSIFTKTIYIIYIYIYYVYIWASIARYLPPPPTPWLWVCIVAPQYPPPPCGVGGVGGGGWWWVVVGGGGWWWVVVYPPPPCGVGGVGGGGWWWWKKLYMYVYECISTPLPPVVWVVWVVVVVEEVVYVCI